MNRVKKTERAEIYKEAEGIYHLLKGDRDNTIIYLMSKFSISKARALTAYGHAMLYWNHPERKVYL